MKILAALVLAVSAFGQPALMPSAPSIQGAPGSKVTFGLLLSGSAADGAGISGVDFALAGLPYTATTAVPGKIIKCAGTVCMVVGGDPTNLNADVMPNGLLASVTVTVPVAPVTLKMGPIHAVNPAGAEILITGSSVIVTPPPTTSACDLNGDGLVDASDLSVFLSAFISGNCTADLNANGVCDVIDWQRLITAAKGQGCRTGQ